MKPFDNFLLDNGKGSRLQWGSTHVHLVRKTASGIRSQSLPIPAEWRNAGGPKLARWEKPWIKAPHKPKPRPKHNAPVLWQETETVHPAGFVVISKRETGGTRESFRVDAKGESGKAFALFALRQVWAHLLFSLPRPIARKLANPAERSAIVQRAHLAPSRIVDKAGKFDGAASLANSIARWIREAESEQADGKRNRRERQAAKKLAKRQA